MPKKSPLPTSEELWAELLAQVERDDGPGTWLRNIGDRIRVLEDGLAPADRAIAERLTEIETDGTSKRLEQLEEGLATALGSGLVMSWADLEGRLQALEELMVPIDEKGIVGMAMGNHEQVTELAGVVLDHTKQLERLEDYNVTRLTPMLNERGATADRLGIRLTELDKNADALAGVVLRHTQQLGEVETVERVHADYLHSDRGRLEEIEGRADILASAASATVDRLGELEAHRALYDAADPDLLEGDAETLVDTDDVDDELRILRRANLAASVAAEVAGLDGAHIVSPILGLLLDLVAHDTVGIDELEQYNDAAGCVLSLLTISEELRDRPQLGTAAVVAAHSLSSTLRDELEGRGALGVDCG